MTNSLAPHQRRIGLMICVLVVAVPTLLLFASRAPGDTQSMVRHRVDWACLQGRAVVREERSAIDFIARCSANRKHKVGFLVRRFKLPGSAGNEISIINVRSRPIVKGSGSPARYGSCRLRSRIAECTGRGRGLVKVTGRVWVRGGKACQAGVALTEIRGPRCARSECLGTPSVHDFLRARPSGC